MGHLSRDITLAKYQEAKGCPAPIQRWGSEQFGRRGLSRRPRDPVIFSGGSGYIWRFRPIHPIKLCLVPRKMLYFFGFGQAFTYLFEEYLDSTGITCYNGQTSERM